MIDEVAESDERIIMSVAQHLACVRDGCRLGGLRRDGHPEPNDDEIAQARAAVQLVWDAGYYLST